MFIFGMLVGIVAFVSGFLVGVKIDIILSILKPERKNNPFEGKNGLLSYKNVKRYGYEEEDE